MGQYHLTVNLDKREFINPHKIGLGLKLREQIGFAGSIGDLIFMLLACSNGRGGGDIQTETKKLVGRWAGDRIAVIGDYAEKKDIRGVNAADIYFLCHDTEFHGEDEKKILKRLRKKGLDLFTDISDELVPLLNEQFDCGLDPAGDGWRRRKQKTPLAPDMIIQL